MKPFGSAGFRSFLFCGPSDQTPCEPRLRLERRFSGELGAELARKGTPIAPFCRTGPTAKVFFGVRIAGKGGLDMRTNYETDVVAWASEQARLIRAGRFDLLDCEHIAEEIEDVGKSEQRELANRMAVLLAHLLKWQFQPELRGTSWELTIKNQRHRIVRRLEKTPSLKACLNDSDWWADAWGDACEAASAETGIGLEKFPEACAWSIDSEILCESWLPE